MSAPHDRQPAADLTTHHVGRALDGDADSLSWLVERLTPLLRAHARYRLGPGLATQVDPDDLVQEAWLTLLPQLADFTPTGARRTPALLAFLTRTIVWRIQNLARKHARRGAVHSVAPTPGADLDGLQADQTGVVTRVLHSERIAAVQRELELLSPDEREVLLLRGVEQLPNTTVATLLGIAPGAASMRYQRALRSLRLRLPDSVFAELDDDPGTASSADTDAATDSDRAEPDR